MVGLARERFYWVNIQRDIEDFENNPCSCIKSRKPQPAKKAPLVSIKTTRPFQLVSIDYVHLEKSSGGYEYILVVVDYFTRFAQVCLTTNRSYAMTFPCCLPDNGPQRHVSGQILHGIILTEGTLCFLWSCNILCVYSLFHVYALP